MDIFIFIIHTLTLTSAINQPTLPYESSPSQGLKLLGDSLQLSLIIANYRRMKGSGSQQQTPLYKKIQNYIFKFSNLLGQGNFSKVYSGTNELTNEIVAIKIVELESLKSKKLQELLFSQIDVLKRLNHPNVLRCFDVFTSNRNCYIITELCNEGDLESKLRKHNNFTETRAQPYIRDIFQGLVYLNDNQVIHRDIKVANIFIHNGRAKIADFGFAKFTKEKFKDMSIGSPLYMSPEGFVNNIYGPKTDVWAFGVLIYQLLHGYTPYSNCRTENQLRQSLSIPIGRAQIKAQISHELKEVIMACMEVDEAKRVSVPQLKMFSYFRVNLTSMPFLQTNSKGFGQNSEDRLRPPSYNGQDRAVRTFGNIGKQKSTFQGNFHSQQEAPRKEAQLQSPEVSSFVQQTQSYTSKNAIQVPSDRFGTKDRRAISSQRSIPNEFPRSVGKEQPQPKQPPKNHMKALQILSGTLTFKECVNILHYARLIFKFLLMLKVSVYSNNNELFKLTRWLMEVLAEISEKIERKEVVYQGENASLREKKLREVREEYSKKYRSELQNYIQGQEHYGDSVLELEYMINFCYNIFQKYDGMIVRDSPTTLLMLAHSVLLIYHTTKLIRDCYDARNYCLFSNYKEIETFLGLKKEEITMDSYLTARKKVMAY